MSAAVVVYNRRALVCRALDSILAQSTPVDENIVVDDGSTDGTADAVERRYGPKVRLIRQANTGVSGARRRALMEAHAEWLAFLDSDDEWTPDRNATLLAAAARLPPAIPWIFGDAEIITDDHPHDGPRRLFDGGNLSVAAPCTVYDDPMPTQYPYQFSYLMTSLIRASVLREVDAFAEDLRSSEDLLAGWKVAAQHPMAAIPRVVTRIHRTAELAPTSTDLAGKSSPDYFRARVLGFDLLARSNRPGPWGREHAKSVRRWCIRLAQSGRAHPLPLALHQFRHAFTPAAAAFTAAALLGRPGVRAWTWATTRRDRALGPEKLTFSDPVAYRPQTLRATPAECR